jgi:hypothetical protein
MTSPWSEPCTFLRFLAVYVRDNGPKGFAPIVDEETHAPGPKGHHYTVEYLCPPGNNM